MQMYRFEAIFLSFIFLTILPGMIIINILRLTNLNFTEKFVLSWGISLSL